jgi:thiamine phosphate synthase YjbQ (UPF0047 family)
MREVMVTITEGRLDFGAWGQVFYLEFDRKPSKYILVKITGN